ncbi:hypothetical protein D3C86_2012660 [compost metagenome]
MRHINEEQCAYIVSDGCQCFEINRTRVRTCTSYEHARLVFESCFTNIVVVDAEIFFAYTVSYEVVKNTGSIHRAAVC